jgi:hypothetical protein
MITRRPATVSKHVSSVWAYLEREGGINERLYDGELVAELRSNLGLSSHGRITTELETHDISVEALIHAFFRLAAPFAEMSSDILVMFEKAGARRSSTNLKVVFDFNKKAPELKFDIRHFRDFLEIFERVRTQILTREWPRELLWRLYPPTSRSDPDVTSPDLRGWASIFDSQKWPDRLPPVPVSGHEELDSLTSAIWPLINDVVRRIKHFGFAPGRLFTEYHGGRIPAGEVERISTEWDIDTLVSLDSDFWAPSAILSHEILARTLARGAPLSPDLSRWMEQDLPNLLNQVRTRFSTEETLQRRLEEILNLPVWRQRHQVYSVWVASRILEALGWDRLTIYTVGDELRFEFKETHLASTRGRGEPLHLMAELRSPLKAPIGKSRTQSIQPDFRLVSSPIHDLASHKLVVECKQYLRPSRRNFVEALTDYARGTPKAIVTLVSYSDASESEITSLVPTGVRPRTKVIAPFRPGQPAPLEHFRNIVQAVAGSHREEGSVTFDHELLRIELTWSGAVDLDLHLFIGEPTDEMEHIYYGYQRDRQSFAQLSEDVRDGPGSEWLKISREDKRPYWVFVHHYSGTLPMKDANPVIQLGLGTTEPVVVRPPRSNANAWWVCRLVPESNEFEVINQPCSIDEVERLCRTFRS